MFRIFCSFLFALSLPPPPSPSPSFPSLSLLLPPSFSRPLVFSQFLLFPHYLRFLATPFFFLLPSSSQLFYFFESNNLFSLFLCANKGSFDFYKIKSLLAKRTFYKLLPRSVLKFKYQIKNLVSGINI